MVTKDQLERAWDVALEARIKMMDDGKQVISMWKAWEAYQEILMDYFEQEAAALHERVEA